MILAILVACHREPAETGDTAVDPRRWEVLHEDLPGVLLSISGRSSTDYWVVGANGGAGPEVHRWDGAAWTAPDPGVSANLWWVFAQGDASVWLSGDAGTLVRYDRAADAFQTVATPTTATLFGVWGPSDDVQYTVGGFVGGGEGAAGVILRIDAGVASAVTGLPAEVDPDEIYFKVWGSGPSDVWVVGDHGGMLHWDGHAWTRRVMPDAPRLVTISGSGADDRVIVGGDPQGAIFAWTDGAWEDVSPSHLPPLNGVFVGPGGVAAATGFFGTALERVDGAWLSLPPAERSQDWHAAWVDENGAIYAAGGNFMNLTSGALYRYAAP